jgi:hypothetical protein
MSGPHGGTMDGGRAAAAPGHKVTPGRQAHDARCRFDDWDELDDETRQVWEDAATAHDAAQAAVDPGGEA